jgi:RNA polymerase sigma-70 factor (ECF subfamily)
VLEEMADDLRAVFVLFEIEEMSAQQISELMDIPLGTAKSRLRRAREDFAERVRRARGGGDG